MVSGTIAKITAKGFGFIKPTIGDADVFFHVTGMVDRSLYDSLEAGTAVTYDTVEGDDGRTRAVEVRVVD